jgi:hypothetical protein
MGDLVLAFSLREAYVVPPLRDPVGGVRKSQERLREPAREIENEESGDSEPGQKG